MIEIDIYLMNSIVGFISAFALHKAVSKPRPCYRDRNENLVLLYGDNRTVFKPVVDIKDIKITDHVISFKYAKKEDIYTSFHLTRLNESKECCVKLMDEKFSIDENGDYYFEDKNIKETERTFNTDNDEFQTSEKFYDFMVFLLDLPLMEKIPFYYFSLEYLGEIWSKGNVPMYLDVDGIEYVSNPFKGPSANSRIIKFSRIGFSGLPKYKKIYVMLDKGTAHIGDSGETDIELTKISTIRDTISNMTFDKIIDRYNLKRKFLLSKSARK